MHKGSSSLGSLPLHITVYSLTYHKQMTLEKYRNLPNIRINVTQTIYICLFTVFLKIWGHRIHVLNIASKPDSCICTDFKSKSNDQNYKATQHKQNLHILCLPECHNKDQYTLKHQWGSAKESIQSDLDLWNMSHREKYGKMQLTVN